jgi:hypothetical protein
VASPSDDLGNWLAEARAGSREALGRVFEECRPYLLRIAQPQLDPDLQAKGGASATEAYSLLELDNAHGKVGRPFPFA